MLLFKRAITLASPGQIEKSTGKTGRGGHGKGKKRQRNWKNSEGVLGRILGKEDSLILYSNRGGKGESRSGLHPSRRVMS